MMGFGFENYFQLVFEKKHLTKLCVYFATGPEKTNWNKSSEKSSTSICHLNINFLATKEKGKLKINQFENLRNRTPFDLSRLPHTVCYLQLILRRHNEHSSRYSLLNGVCKTGKVVVVLSRNAQESIKPSDAKDNSLEVFRRMEGNSSSALQAESLCELPVPEDKESQSGSRALAFLARVFCCLG